MTKIVSFVIPHKGREEMLWLTVLSVAELDAELDELEVIIATQNRRLDVPSYLSDTGLTIKVIHPKEGVTISQQRNEGAEHASGEYLGFLDADVALSKNWVNVMKRLLAEKPSRKLVSAMQVNGVNAPVLERIRTVLSNAELDCNVNFLPGRNLFLHRDTFYKVGGFPQHLLTCEDYYFTDKVHELGDLYYSSDAQYIHLGEDKILGKMYEKEIWRGQSNLQSLKGRDIPLREWPSFIVPPLIMVLLIISLVNVMFQNGIAAICSLISAFLPVLAYSLRLHQLSAGELPLGSIIKFYLVYFPARAIGTILGLVKSVHVKET